MRWRASTHLVLAAVLVAGVTLAGMAPVAPTLAQGSASPVPGDIVPHITVVGRASLSVSPDIARANIGVQTTGPNIAQAVAENSTAMDAVLAALQGAGVAEEDVQTSDYSIFLDPGVEMADMPAEPTYQVRHMVLVTVRDFERVGEVIQAAVDAGANQLYGVSFELSDTTEVETRARELAVADARQRAESLASLAGGSVGELISMSEVVTGGVAPVWGAGAPAPEVGPGIVPGQIQFSTSIQVTYALELGGMPTSTPVAGVTTTPAATGTGTPKPEVTTTATAEAAATGTPEPEASATGTVVASPTVALTETPKTTATAAPEGTPAAEGTAAPSGTAIALNPPAIPHELEGREDCLVCHAVGTGVEPAPESHVDFIVDQCQTCHKPAVDGGVQPEVPVDITLDLCLFCHGPYEDLQARTEAYQVSEQVTVNPHQFVPHESTDPGDIPECKNCHQPHPLPVTDEVTIEEPGVRWCFAACHHTGTFNPCSDCH